MSINGRLIVSGNFSWGSNNDRVVVLVIISWTICLNRYILYWISKDTTVGVSTAGGGDELVYSMSWSSSSVE